MCSCLVGFTPPGGGTKPLFASLLLMSSREVWKELSWERRAFQSIHQRVSFLLKPPLRFQPASYPGSERLMYTSHPWGAFEYYISINL